MSALNAQACSEIVARLVLEEGDEVLVTTRRPPRARKRTSSESVIEWEGCYWHVSSSGAVSGPVDLDRVARSRQMLTITSATLAIWCRDAADVLARRARVTAPHGHQVTLNDEKWIVDEGLLRPRGHRLQLVR